MNESFYRHILWFLFHSGCIPKVKLLGHMIILCSEKWPNSFPKWLWHFIFLPVVHEDCNPPHLHQHLLFVFSSITIRVGMSSIQFSRSVVSHSLRPHGLQHARPPCPSPTPRVTQTHVHWVSDAIQPSHPVIPFSSCLQSLPASGSFPVSQFFASGGQRIGVSASASVLSMNIQDWFPVGLTGWISLLSKGLSRIFSNTTIWKHQFFSTHPSLWSNFTSVHD